VSYHRGQLNQNPEKQLLANYNFTLENDHVWICGNCYTVIVGDVLTLNYDVEYV